MTEACLKESKVCSGCGEEKSYEDYRKRKDSKDGFRADCKACQAVVSRKYYQENKEKLSAASKKWRQENPEKSDAIYAKYRKTEKRRKVNREWARRNRRKQLDRFVERYHTEPEFNIAIKYRRRIHMAIRKQYTSKATKSIELLGISFEGLKEYIEKQFTEGMCWDKLMNGEIHLDHIRPCSSYDLTNEEQQKQCFHYTNLQPLWAEENLRKGGDWYDDEDQSVS